MSETYPPLTGKRALITGATNGHGQALALKLAELGARCVILGRNRDRCETTARLIMDRCGSRPDIVRCDLAARDDVMRAAKEIMAMKEPLNILVNNAGMVNRRYSETADGFEETFAVNYLSLYMLTLLIAKKITDGSPARIINVSSETHRMTRLDLNDLQGSGRPDSSMGAYGRSKLAIIYFTLELSKKLRDTGVTVNAVDPGPVASGIADKPGILAGIANAVIQRTFPSPERACRTALHLAASPDLEGQTGGYYRFMKKKEPGIDRADPALGEKIMARTASMTGIAWDILP